MCAPGTLDALNTASSGVSAAEHFVNISVSTPGASDWLTQMKSIFAPGGRSILSAAGTKSGKPPTAPNHPRKEADNRASQNSRGSGGGQEKKKLPQKVAGKRSR